MSSATTAIRVCRNCGCDDDHACAGGCRWTDAGRICSRCKPPVFAACILCGAPAPPTAEDAIQDGWTEHGVCPEHRGRHPLPFVRADRTRRSARSDDSYPGPFGPV